MASDEGERVAQQRDPIADSVWGRGPRRSAARATGAPAPAPGLSRDQIVAAAIDLLDADGAAGLSMRKLGQRLGAGTTSVYWHVADKNELIDLALDEVWLEIALPDEGPHDWREALARFVHGFRNVLLAHPWIVAFIGDRPNVGPNSTRVSERMLGLLVSLGFSIQDSAFAAGALSSYALGNAIADVAWRSAQERSGMGAEELFGRYGEYYASMGDQYPNLTAWMKANEPLDMDSLREQTFEFGLQRQLDGLAMLLER